MRSAPLTRLRCMLEQGAQEISGLAALHVVYPSLRISHKGGASGPTGRLLCIGDEMQKAVV
jgi:hypothetical protein